ncbi:hypothetical protein F2981_33700 (plasmid) [Sinorhizobium meliloti]|nr:hypothetical protein [Sinorhizobium meliloti]
MLETQPKGKAGEYSDRRTIEGPVSILSFFVDARLRKDLVREGHPLGKDDWLLLDLYGTTHDARLFPRPAVFNPSGKSSWRNGTSASFHKEEVARNQPSLPRRENDGRDSTRDIEARLPEAALFE